MDSRDLDISSNFGYLVGDESVVISYGNILWQAIRQSLPLTLSPYARSYMREPTPEVKQKLSKVDLCALMIAVQSVVVKSKYVAPASSLVDATILAGGTISKSATTTGLYNVRFGDKVNPVAVARCIPQTPVSAGAFRTRSDVPFVREASRFISATLEPTDTGIKSRNFSYDFLHDCNDKIDDVVAESLNDTLKLNVPMFDAVRFKYEYSPTYAYTASWEEYVYSTVMPYYTYENPVLNNVIVPMIRNVNKLVKCIRESDDSTDYHPFNLESGFIRPTVFGETELVTTSSKYRYEMDDEYALQTVEDMSKSERKGERYNSDLLGIRMSCRNASIVYRATDINHLFPKSSHIFLKTRNAEEAFLWVCAFASATLVHKLYVRNIEDVKNKFVRKINGMYKLNDNTLPFEIVDESIFKMRDDMIIFEPDADIPHHNVLHGQHNAELSLILDAYPSHVVVASCPLQLDVIYECFPSLAFDMTGYYFSKDHVYKKFFLCDSLKETSFFIAFTMMLRMRMASSWFMSYDISAIFLDALMPVPEYRIDQLWRSRSFVFNYDKTSSLSYGYQVFTHFFAQLVYERGDKYDKFDNL